MGRINRGGPSDSKHVWVGHGFPGQSSPIKSLSRLQPARHSDLVSLASRTSCCILHPLCCRPSASPNGMARCRETQDPKNHPLVLKSSAALARDAPHKHQCLILVPGAADLQPALCRLFAAPTTHPPVRLAHLPPPPPLSLLWHRRPAGARRGSLTPKSGRCMSLVAHHHHGARDPSNPFNQRGIPTGGMGMHYQCRLLGSVGTRQASGVLRKQMAHDLWTGSKRAESSERHGVR